MFNFDIKNTSAYRALKITSFPLFKYASFLSQLFFYIFIISLFLIGFSFLGFLSELLAMQIAVLFLFCFMFFLETHLFVESKIKNPKISLSLDNALLQLDNYNIAEFFSLDLCRMVNYAIVVSRQKRLAEVTPEALLYSALFNNTIQMLLLRLGIDVKKLQADLRNYLEKSRSQSGRGSSDKIENPRQGRDSIESGQERQQKFELVFSESFQNTLKESAKIAHSKGKGIIGEKELLMALVKHDDFFKKVLIEYDLKEKDVEHITLWLDSLESHLKASKRFWSKENLLRFGSFGKDWVSGFTVTLDQFCVDLREVVSKQMFNELIGHEKEISNLETILAKSSQSNALIVGDGGIGRKSIVEALAQRCYLNLSLPELNNKRVVELDMVAILSRIQDQEKLEVTLDEIFQEVLSAGNVILVIDKLENFVTQKVQKPGEVDISVILSKYLAIPSFEFIGITSYDGLHKKLEQNSSFLEYFRKIEVSEVSELETIRILQNLVLSLEYKYGILIIYPSIREIVNLTGRYFPTVPFPKKAIDILYEAASYVKASKEKVVLPSHIAKIISDKTQIPIGKVEFKEKSVLLNLEKLIHQRIINQDEAVVDISVAMRRARSGLGSKKRPMGVFLFLGPTGVGKTETAKALAEIYFGRVAKDFSEVGSSSSRDLQATSSDLGEKKMIRLDMSEFQAISDIPRLIGAISPVEEQGLLTMPVRENPFSLVLLDEIEKAHPNILNLFLQVFDEGYITDGQGRKVMFTNTIIICTSNAGANMIFQSIESGKELDKNALLKSLFEKGTFRPEFINRFDATVIFQPLTRESLTAIAQLMLSSLAKALKEKDIIFEITDALKEKIVELSYKPEFGAREMRRVVQDNIENRVAEALLSDKIIKGDIFQINPEDFAIIINQ